MAINYAVKYSGKVAEHFKRNSFTEVATNKDYDFLGVKSVRVYSVDTVAMNDYTRSGADRYGSPAELNDTYQELQLSKDRSFTFTIDAGNNADQELSKNAAKALKRQIDEVVMPEIDTYRLAAWINGADEVKTYGSNLTTATIIAAIADGATALDNKLVPNEGRTIFMAATYYNILRQTQEFLGLEKLGVKALAKGVVGEIDGMQVVKVPDSYLPGGCFFIIAFKDAIVAPVKLQEYKTHKNPPGINGALVEGRVYYDAFVLGTKSKGIYGAINASNACAAPTFNPVSGGAVTPGTTTIAISCGTGGSTIKYTLDGSDPKTSSSALTYASAIATTGWSGTRVVRAYACKSGLVSSGVSTATYTV